ncbi:MAG: phosphohydrolase [Bacteroidia bacterium]
MKVTEANNYILEKLTKELDSNLHYHSIHHIKDVLRSSIQLANLENIGEYEQKLISTAVCYHDSGFLYQYKDHEERSCIIAREDLPGFGFNQQDIDIICGMIMATKIPQSPHNLLEQIVCDADLDYLGRDDFWTIGANLYKELNIIGVLQNEEQWNKLQLNFLTNHQFFTNSAKNLREQAKLAHLDKIINIVNNYSK